MSTRGSRRPEWPELPAELRRDVEAALGSPVVASSSRTGGWSPGSADVVEPADGRRAFVKSADSLVNDRTVQMHRQEAAVLRALDRRVAPELLAVADRPPWFALVVGAIDGRHPDPASPRDTRAVLDAVAALPDAPPGPLLGPLKEELVHDALGWSRPPRTASRPRRPGARGSVAWRSSRSGCPRRWTAAPWSTATCGSTTPSSTRPAGDG